MKRKPTKNTRGPNAEEKRYQAWLKEQPCCICICPGPSIVHHCEGATFKHNKTLVGHYFCIPLCESHDHIVTMGSRRKFRELYGPQSELWKTCAFGYQAEFGKVIPEDIWNSILDWGK